MSAHFVRHKLVTSVHSWNPRGPTRTMIARTTRTRAPIPSSKRTIMDAASQSELFVLGLSILILLILLGFLIYTCSRHKFRYLQDKFGNSSSNVRDVEHGDGAGSHKSGKHARRESDHAEARLSESQRRFDRASEHESTKAQKLGKRVEKDAEWADKTAKDVKSHAQSDANWADKKAQRAAKKLKDSAKEGEKRVGKWNKWRGKNGDGVKESSRVGERSALLQKDGAGDVVCVTADSQEDNSAVDCELGLRKRSGCLSR